MADEYHMSNKEKDELAQRMGFDSWNEYNNLDISKIPENETKTMLRDNSISNVPDLTLSEEEKKRLSDIPTHGGLASRPGKFLWRLEHVLDIHKFREESISKGKTYRGKPCPNWDYTTSEMNKKYGEDFTIYQVRLAYVHNKHLFADEEE